MLDSSPLALPAMPRPLKRSASTASLPTPPRTRRRRRVRLGSSVPSDSDSDGVVVDSSDEEIVRGTGENDYKKRGASGDAEAEEDCFWMGSNRSKTLSSAESSPETRERQEERSPSASPVPLLHRRKQLKSTSLGAAPVSPPPSRRAPRVATSKNVVKCVASVTATSVTTSPEAAASATPSTASPPVTPDNKVKRREKNRYKGPIRDSPDNPFIEESADLSGAEGQDNWSPVGPRTPPEERPTLTYVFRGVKTQFINPHYDHVNKRPLPPDPNSLLPPDHPDYSGDLSCPPKLLFPQVHRKRPRVRETRSSAKRAADSSDDESNSLRSRMQLPPGFKDIAEPLFGGEVRGAGLRRSPRRRAGSNSALVAATSGS